MIQLKLRTEYTFGKTFAPLDRVIERCKALGVKAAGIVDEGSTWGHVPWFRKCKAAGIQPLLGVDLVVSDDDSGHRMWFLAKNKEGLGELYRFTSKAHSQPIVGKLGRTPRLYKNDVRGISTNVLIFSGDVLDEELLDEVGAIFDLSPASRVLNAKKQSMAERLGARIVNISDNDYAFKEDSETFEFMSRPSIKPSAQHIIELPDNPDAEAIALECAGMELPVAPMVRANGDLEALCRDGIKYRKMEDRWTEEYETRLLYELELIRSKDFESYFIVVADMVHYAKEHMLVGPSRGSAAGSLVCYLARITEIDPLPPKLYFERFIDVSRTDLPDIDLDFPDDKRHLVFEYMADKYGSENVSHIGTVSQFRPKSALIQVCKALNIPPSATGAVKVAMIERSSADSRANNCLLDTFETTVPGKEFISMYPKAAIASRLEGHASNTGVHAAGLLVSNEPITNYATVDSDGIAHVDKGSAEFLGLLKIDVLGLRTLGILEDSGVPIDWYGLKFDDPATFDVFNAGRLSCIFQFEGNALRAISNDVHFETIVEIDAVTALARPGPFGGGVTDKYIRRKNGERYQPIHPLVEEHMQETFGLPVYQEQTLAIVRYIGKFDWKETSTIRKAMSKRMGKEFFDSYWAKFREGALSQGIGEEAARATWEMINAMGAWQMNKAHTYSYAVISYWTAYLKAHHPLEFAAANLRSAKDEDSAINLLREMAREGVEYVPFDLEKSKMNWSVQDGKLYGGFMALKGIGESKAAKLMKARDEGKLSAKQVKEVEAAENVFGDIFPFRTNYGHLYDHPHENGIASNLVTISELDAVPSGDERVFLGEVIHKNLRNRNEEILVKRRGGKVEKGQLEFLDLRLRDDTDTIGGRIDRKDFERIGRSLLESVPIGAHIIVRAVFWQSKTGEHIRYAFIKKWKRIDQ